MEQKCEALCDALAKRVVERNFSGAHALFAPWLQQKMTPADIERMVDGAGGVSVQQWTLDEGFLEVGDLVASAREITDENYRGWLCIQFEPGAGDRARQDASFDLWLAAVEVEGDYRVGLLEPAGDA
ncbi:MAG TPA: hypothetical protein VF247_04825 [Candidatus Krumholzibacteria bacterium]